MKNPILCLDFDGVLHSYTSGWQGADVVSDEPVTGAIGFLLMAVQHFDVCIFSSRSTQKGGIAAMRHWLKRHADGAWYESPAGPGIEDVRFVTEKPPALLTIDDRAVQFTGEWPSLEFIRDFTPWNKLSAIVHPARAPADSVLEDAALSSEQQRAIFEAYESAASESYFEVRPQIDCTDRRRVFKAGYERGWDAARKQGGA